MLSLLTNFDELALVGKEKYTSFLVELFIFSALFTSDNTKNFLPAHLPPFLTTLVFDFVLLALLETFGFHFS